jgi:enoyl-CoA hydratase
MSSVHCETRGSSARLVIDRPQAGNALRGQDVDELAGHVRACLRDPAVRAIVIQGSGDRFFCTGGDIGELASGLADVGLHIRKWHDLVDMVEAAEKPIIAAINARVGMPELKVGLFPSAGGVRRLTRIVGASAALHLVLAADLIDAAEAHRRGIVEVVADGSFDAAVDRAAQRLCAYEPNAVRAVLACARTAALGIDSVEMEIALLRECYQTPRNRELLQAFLDGLRGSRQ